MPPARMKRGTEITERMIETERGGRIVGPSEAADRGDRADVRPDGVEAGGADDEEGGDDYSTGDDGDGDDDTDD